MKLHEIHDEWENASVPHNQHMQTLRNKIASLWIKIELLAKKKDDALNHGESVNAIKHSDMIKKLMDKRDTILKQLSKASLNMRYVVHDPELALRHARGVRNGRFPEGEQAIASNAKTAYEYAAEVIKQRFPLGEPTIKNNFDFRGRYEREFNVRL